MSKGHQGMRRSLNLNENIANEDNIPSKKIKSVERSSRATVALVDLDPKGKQNRKTWLNDASKVRIKVKEGRRVFDYSNEHDDNQNDESSQIVSEIVSQSNKTRPNPNVRRQIVFDQPKKGGKNLRSNNLNTNATLSSLGDKAIAVNKGGRDKKLIETSKGQVTNPLSIVGEPEGDEDLVDDVCHDDQFGDGINLDIEGSGTMFDDDDFELVGGKRGNVDVENKGRNKGKQTRVVVPSTSQQAKNDKLVDDVIMSDPRLEYLVEQAVERRVQKVIEA